jgi:hypothetical protein
MACNIGVFVGLFFIESFSLAIAGIGKRFKKLSEDENESRNVCQDPAFDCRIETRFKYLVYLIKLKKRYGVKKIA